ncbi:UNVERIFIED_CONTAM: hypothetical protein Sradi_7296300 [Sesamum radiatum]|uniref:Uncharacterized protein n=1 Tax=Sesamum radiatum TaxID=300843 RepID=A0AAW2IIR3_SESRA
MLSLENDGAPRCATDLMKGALPLGDRRLMSSLSLEDLDHMLTLVLTKVPSFTRRESLSRASGGSGRSKGEASVRKLEEKVDHLQGSGRPEGGEKGGRGEVSKGDEGGEAIAMRGKGLARVAY